MGCCGDTVKKENKHITKDIKEAIKHKKVAKDSDSD